jgi:hypothetical protein
LVPWCHDTPDGVPKAKRSAGHYAIESLIQKTRGVSARVFESDYLCKGPKAAGVWFPNFDVTKHVSAAAEYDPRYEVHCSVDSGVFTGGVFLQVRGRGTESARVTVFADYLSEAVPGGAGVVAGRVLEVGRTHCNGTLDRVTTDDAGGARNPVGPSVLELYRAAGLSGRWGLECWPKGAGSVADTLSLLDSFLTAADGSVWLTIHPRCVHLIRALQNYRRAKRGGQWQDYPEQVHPHEDLVDPLRGALQIEFPGGRVPAGVQTIGTAGKPYQGLHDRRYR